MNLEKIQKNRIIFFEIFCLVLFMILIGRLYFLQIVKGDEYNQRAIKNRVKLVRIPGPRGIILDRNDVPLVDNRQTFAVDVIPEEIEQEPVALKILCETLGINAGLYYDILKEEKPRPGYPVRIAANVPLESIIKLGENRYILKGVYADNIFVRDYPLKNIACHITGYT